ncbi:MAG: HAD hydrolase-like protein [Rhodospirillales bacterium]|nr:HAD hydrolase-like protein [Rhodospirillales bacterium]
MNGVHLVVFDCDGTLADSQHVSTTAMDRAFQLQGLPVPSRASVRGVAGVRLDEVVTMLAPDLNAMMIAAVEEDHKRCFFALRREPDHASVSRSMRGWCSRRWARSARSPR